jgi:hypothetical protein
MQARRAGPRAGALAGVGAWAMGGSSGERARGGSSGRHGGLGQGHALRRMEPRACSMVGGRHGRERKVREDKVKRVRGK